MVLSVKAVGCKFTIYLLISSHHFEEYLNCHSKCTTQQTLMYGIKYWQYKIRGLFLVFHSLYMYVNQHTQSNLISFTRDHILFQFLCFTAFLFSSLSSSSCVSLTVMALVFFFFFFFPQNVTRQEIILGSITRYVYLMLPVDYDKDAS